MAKDFNFCVLLDIYGELLSEKQYEVMDYYYNQDYSLAEISEHLGITRQGVRDSIKRAEQTISECEEKLKLEEKFAKNRSESEKVMKILDNIKALNESSLKNDELEKYIKEIADTVLKLDF